MYEADLYPLTRPQPWPPGAPNGTSHPCPRHVRCPPPPPLPPPPPREEKTIVIPKPIPTTLMTRTRRDQEAAEGAVEAVVDIAVASADEAVEEVDEVVEET